MVILVSATLPDTTGPQLYAALRKEPRIEGVPILLLANGAAGEAARYD
ncbi:hypothetical protein [Paraburkholderia dilworthii]|jgi:two-component system cell cycle response regulator|nr:hypothetical protein [Paraburkholderia dilworthii]